jgi:hypothetical protein
MGTGSHRDPFRERALAHPPTRCASAPCGSLSRPITRLCALARSRFKGDGSPNLPDSSHRFGSSPSRDVPMIVASVPIEGRVRFPRGRRLAPKTPCRHSPSGRRQHPVGFAHPLRGTPRLLRDPSANRPAALLCSPEALRNTSQRTPLGGPSSGGTLSVLGVIPSAHSLGRRRPCSFRSPTADTDRRLPTDAC